MSVVRTRVQHHELLPGNALQSEWQPGNSRLAIGKSRLGRSASSKAIPFTP